MRKKLIIVEHDQDILDIISVIFSEKGYLVSGYSSEKDILAKIHDEKPDAVLLDIIRPTLQGTELCRAIKEAESTKHIPVIVLSTHMRVADLKEVCADDVMAKPFDIDALINAVEKQLLLFAS